MKKLFSLIYFPLAWTIFIQVLLCLPGGALPSTESFEIPNIDKIVHVIFFGTLVAAWCYYLSKRVSNRRSLAVLFFCVFLAASINGIVIEYIQLYFIPFRTFDQADITADIFSAAICYGICNVKLLT